MNTKLKLADVTVTCGPEPIDIAERLEICEGARAPIFAESGTQYEPGARIPSGMWRRLNREELNCIVPSGRAWNRANTVVVVLPPRDVREAIRSLTQESDSIESIARFVLPRHVDVIADLIPTFCNFPNPIIYHGLAINDSNLITVTVNSANGLRTGLHFDDWDRKRLKERALSTNRISLNIGPAMRYFVFVPVTLAVMAGFVLGNGDGLDDIEKPNQIGQLFLANEKDVPVLRVKLFPGEGYIAPTENILHDGSSEGISTVNRHITFRGHFRLKATMAKGSQS
jgi:hypothetical protein